MNEVNQKRIEFDSSGLDVDVEIRQRLKESPLEEYATRSEEFNDDGNNRSAMYMLNENKIMSKMETLISVKQK